jgi:pimeloyl-ACP methyl ester carboxylesterase
MYLQTKDVNLYYERCGKGPTLLMIHGAVADADYFSETVDVLKDYFDVISYDRRGNSRSECRKGASYHIEDQTNDVIALIEGLGLKDVILLGHSAGGIMAMETIRRIPSKIRYVMFYETPIMAILPQKEELLKWTEHMEEINAEGKHKECAKEFGMSIGELAPRARQKSFIEKRRDRANFGHFINHEFHDFSFYEPDFKFLKTNAKFFTAISGDRNQTHYFHEAMDLMQSELGIEQVHVPGCHNAPFDVPLDFANGVLGIAVRKGLLNLT